MFDGFLISSTNTTLTMRAIKRALAALFHTLIVFMCALSYSATTQAQSATMSDDELRKRATSSVGTIPSSMPDSKADTPALITLGESLYFETALSVNRTQSCNSCHNILDGGQGVDNLKTSPGALGENGRRNAPTTWNAGFQFAQNWDAGASSLSDQAGRPILDKKEMAMPSEAEAVARLQPDYQEAFKRAFPDAAEPLTFENITKALAAFQRTLITQDRFDRFLNGDNNALTALEKKGFVQLQKNGCLSCHSGPLMGGQFVMKLGVVVPYPNTEDKGFAEVTGRKDHNFLFKVPMLRNVANTAPYFHDGDGKTLEEAVFLTGWHQFGKKLSDEEVESISAFLRSLNNEKRFTPSDKNNLNES
ncbi:cytochrome-c peroxidase [Aestuariibacter sp. AA17]|uniref:Cytochrome-c peroxidase n=1 Tax=Fluctibacter corallii TaxID=2984329 RepID=A0ABT3A886_9ALTE|nr:cytochrome c peroxidase [Aestuariibacter sp. AA17]MCV2884497.1 cytochrome-c peroxidase [Aestuariibacter sp. AA17]